MCLESRCLVLENSPKSQSPVDNPYCRSREPLHASRSHYRTILGQERELEGYLLHELNPRGGGTAGFEGQRINTPASTAKIRPVQAIWIFFNSRRQSVRKASAVRLSSALAESNPNWRYKRFACLPPWQSPIRTGDTTAARRAATVASM